MDNRDYPRKDKVAYVYLDCSETFQSTARNGIQRVVRNIVKHSRILASEFGISCQPVIRRGNHYYRIPFELQSPINPNLFRERLKRVYYSAMSAILKPLSMPALNRVLLPTAGHHGIFTIPHYISGALQDGLRSLGDAVGLKPSTVVKFQPGDAIIVMEPCTYRQSWKSLELLRAQEVKIGLLVFDLIPLTHPQFCSAGRVAKFRNWLHGIAERVDFFLSISDAVSHEAETYLGKVTQHPSWDTHSFESFRLGADLDASPRNEEISNRVATVFANTDGTPTYLLVATLEPRKNHLFLFDAFESAWQKGSPARLLLVGKVGWMCDATIERIQNHTELGKRLMWFSDLNDSDLEYCYEHASALVYPSITEGFGLPLVEALSHQLLVLASDISVHREVGQDYCVYFDLGDPQQLTEMILKLDRDPQAFQVRDPAEYPAADWRQSCQEFLLGVTKQMRRSSQKADHREEPGDTFSFQPKRQVA